MLPRNARTTLLASRQRLPRPARLYSTPSRKANAPALATASIARPDLPPYMTPQRAPEEQPFQELQSFLNRKIGYTILPPLAPPNPKAPFTDSISQDLAAIMNACLYDCYDVPRAKTIFERVRGNRDRNLLQTPMYNAFLQAYLEMATTRDIEDKHYWVAAAWDLYHAMEGGTELVVPSPKTYATMLLTALRFGGLESTVITIRSLPPDTLLQNIVTRRASVATIVTDIILTHDEATHIISMLSKAALKIKQPQILTELGADTTSVEEGDLPDVRPVTRTKASPRTTNAETKEQEEVPFNISNLRKHLADVSLARQILSDDLLARQKLLEDSAYNIAEARMKEEIGRITELGLSNKNLQVPHLRRWMVRWHALLEKKLEVVLKEIKEKESTYKEAHISNTLHPYLSVVRPNRLSLIAILEIMRLQGSGGIADGMKTARALISVGKAVELEFKAQMCKANNIHTSNLWHRPETKIYAITEYLKLQENRVAAAEAAAEGENWTATWSQAVRAKVGSILVECLMDVAEVTRTAFDPKTNKMISEQQPAFYHAYEYQRGQKLGVIRLNPVVAERLAIDGVGETLHPRHLPMLVPPSPWLDYNRGGYLHNHTYAMRFKDSVEQEHYIRKASAKGQLELLYAGLDVLGRTPWRINKKIYEVILEVWNSGKRLAKIAPAVYDESEPTISANGNVDLKARNVFLLKQRAYYQAKANNHSERCSVNYKIEVARAFLNDVMYMPHNVDFRGRAYPIPPHLNHIGDDLCRGLMQFDAAKPLGVRGLRWLKIHLANLYGYDKAKFDEREDWVMARLDKVYDSATKPLTGERWWLWAEDPWQCLAVCTDLHAALESGDPESYESRLPVHQDGTCNGLQHYAALGGDTAGAQQVNLAAGDRPADVYSHVGMMVEKMMQKDLENKHKYALMLQGKVSRKVVKQTVMTTVYGVTFVGAREQIERQLKDRRDVPAEECWNAAAYLAKIVLVCIGDLFSGANRIQTWLNLAARLISKSIPPERLAERKTQGNHSVALRKEQMTTVIWTTPLGLPIVQPYRRTAKTQIMTSIQSVFISDPNAPAGVNSSKQASAFPPNFIHSLDATHMMLTALKCNSLGLTFASVHDSYWTHACDIDAMSEIIRGTFISLHSSDVLEKLRAEFMERYKDYKLPIAALKMGHLVQHLEAAGTRIVTTPQEAPRLDLIKELLVIEDAEMPSEQPKATITEAAVSDLDAFLADLAKDDADEDLPSWIEQEQEAKGKGKGKGKGKKKKAPKSEQPSLGSQGVFVNFTDLLPPLPKKGSFDVGTIKSSQYFFS